MESVGREGKEKKKQKTGEPAGRLSEKTLIVNFEAIATVKL